MLQHALLELSMQIGCTIKAYACAVFQGQKYHVLQAARCLSQTTRTHARTHVRTRARTHTA